MKLEYGLEMSVLIRLNYSYELTLQLHYEPAIRVYVRYFNCTFLNLFCWLLLAQFS